MKLIHGAMLIIVAMVMMMTGRSLLAQPERLVHYQGSLVDSSGTPFSGSVDLRFNIYETPRAERPLWSEAHENLHVNDGTYDVLLGSKNPLKLSFYEYYLDVETPAGVQGSSRKMIVGSGYNYRLWFLFAAYTVVWLAIFLYMLSIARRQRKIIADLELVKQVTQEQQQIA